MMNKDEKKNEGTRTIIGTNIYLLNLRKHSVQFSSFNIKRSDNFIRFCSLRNIQYLFATCRESKPIGFD